MIRRAPLLVVFVLVAACSSKPKKSRPVSTHRAHTEESHGDVERKHSRSSSHKSDHPKHEHAHGPHPHAAGAHHHHNHPHPHLDGPNGHHHPY